VAMPTDMTQAAQLIEAPASEQVSETAGPTGRVATLQRAAGNRATAALLGRVQPKLTVGASDDRYEREADSVAARVVRALHAAGGAPAPRGDTTTGDATTADRPPTSLARRVQRMAGAGPSTMEAAPIGAAGGEVDDSTERQIRSARSGGRPLDTDTRSSMEDAFGADFGGVRIHTGAESTKLNRQINAEAFTYGNDIFFRGSAPDAGSAGGQELLAHELTHTVQQGGGARRMVHRKMWTKAAFAKATSEGALTGKSSAQTTMELLIIEYIKKFEGNGVVLPKDYSAAVNLLLQMRETSTMWIDEHTTDVDNGLGGVATVTDPSRKKRMAGMRTFQTYLDGEITLLQDSQRKKGDDVTTDITDKHAGFVKFVEKKTQAKSLFEKVGRLGDKLVSNDGDSTEIEVELKFPVDPSGVGFIGGRFSAEIEKDGEFTRIRSELAITGGASIDFVEVAGEVGGYIEAQAKTAADAMNLVSYDLYRRFRESHVIPNECANYLWGGNWGSYGKGKSENWSLALEKKYFALADPDPTSFKTPEAYEAAKAKIEKAREEIYVESGGLIGASASMDGGVVEGEVSAGFTEGRRIDHASLNARKGGAGEKNLGSDSFIAKGARALTGGTRGAQKSVGRAVRTFSLGASLGGSVPGFTKIEGETGLQLTWMSDGARKSQGETPQVTLTGNDLEMSLSAEVPFANLGPGTGKLIDWLSEKLRVFVRNSITKAEKETEAGKGTTNEVVTGVKDMVSVTSALKEASEPASEAEGGMSLAGAEISGGTTLKLTMALDGASESIEGSLDFSRVDEKKLEIPKILEAKLTRAKRILKISYEGGKWSVS
jgi:hypothetical protein